MDNDHKNEPGQENFSLKAQFSERLNFLLRRKSLTQAELSRLTGEGASKINEYSKGRILPSAMTAIALAEALDVSVPFLMLGRAGTADAAQSVPILDASRVLPDSGRDVQLYTAQMTLDAVHGGAPYGATTIAGGDGARQPSDNELDAARYLGARVANTANKLFG